MYSFLEHHGKYLKYSSGSPFLSEPLQRLCIHKCIANQRLANLLAVPRRLFWFGSLLVLDVVCGYVLLFVLDIKTENR